MSERYVTLLGAEQVQSASNQMRQAAHEMQAAAATIAAALDYNQRFLNDWLPKFESVLKENLK